MTWTVDWTPTAIASLQRIHWRDAERVVAAVEHFAATSKGRTYQLDDDDAVTWRLRVGSYRVRVTFDPWEGVMRVWYVYRA